MNSQIKDLSGMKFGRLTVVSYAGSQSGRKAMWLCKCDCGAEVVKRGDTIQTRNTGCGGPTCMRSKKNNYPSTGDKFGMLTAMSFSMTNKKSGGLYWLFQCDCGNQVSRRWHQVKTGKLDHCGCQSSKKLVEARYGNTDRSIVVITELLRSYKKNASNRNLEFLLTLEQFSHLIKQNCFYCGAEPGSRRRARKRQFLKNPDDLIYNGIERWKSTEGYNKTNCVPCCFICNYSKRTLDGMRFIRWIRSISERCGVDDSVWKERKKAIEISL